MLGAVGVGLEEDEDFVFAGFFDAEGKAGAGVFVGSVAVVFADVGLQTFWPLHRQRERQSGRLAHHLARVPLDRPIGIAAKEIKEMMKVS